MTMKARDLLRQRGLSYEEIMSAQWYDLPESRKYLPELPPSAPGSQTSSSLQPPSSHHQLSPLEVHSPGSVAGMPGLRQGSLEHVNGIRDVEEAMREWRVSSQQVRTKSPEG